MPRFRGAFFYVPLKKTNNLQKNLRLKRALRKSFARAPLYRYYLGCKPDEIGIITRYPERWNALPMRFDWVTFFENPSGSIFCLFINQLSVFFGEPHVRGVYEACFRREREGRRNPNRPGRFQQCFFVVYEAIPRAVFPLKFFYVF